MHMLNNISIKTKLLIMLFVPLILFATTSIYLLQLNSSNINMLTSALYDTSNRATTLVLNADRDMYQAYSAYQQLQSTYVSQADKDAAAIDFTENVQQVDDRIQQALDILNKENLTLLSHSTSGKTINAIIQDVDLLFNNWVEQANSNIQKMTFSLSSEAKLLAQFQDARENINQFGEILDVYAVEKVTTINEEKNRTNLVTYTALIIEWILLCLFGFILIRKLTRTVALVQLKTKQVSAGDLIYSPQKKYDKDELGQILFSVDNMIGIMRGLIGSIADNTKRVAVASDELSHNAQESTSAASHVAENIQEVTSLIEVQSTITEEASKAIEEMSIGVQRIAESTNTIAEHSHETNHQADQGAEMLNKLRQQMNQMMDTIWNLNQSIATLNEKSAKIGAITEKITGFANQTGILSLNASIEAARAGEHGRGFAVVAHEIRKLATQSLESAEVINELIADTQSEIDQASEHMRTTVVQGKSGTSILDDVANGFETIALSIKQIAEQIHDSSAVTEQMSASSEEVSAGMEQSSSSAKNISDKAQDVAAATEEQLALVENIAHAADQLRSIVGSLNDSVRYFKL